MALSLDGTSDKEEMSASPHIVHACASGGFYGIERVLESLLPRLSTSGWRVSFICFGSEGEESGLVGERLRNAHIPVRFLGINQALKPAQLLAFARTARDLSANLLHVHGYKATIVAGLTWPLVQVPLVATCHSETRYTPELWRQFALEALVLRRMKTVVAVSSGVVADLTARRIRNSVVIQNGIPGTPSEQPSPNPTRPTIVVVGRLVKGKNVHILLAALPRLVAEFPSLQLLVAGDGPEQEALRIQTGELGLSANVSFLGFVSDTGLILDRATIFVMPSESEGVPMALLEAMAHGLPIVASAVGGIPSIVENGNSAVLVRPGDSRQLADAIASLLRNSSQAAEVGGRARERFEEAFTADIMTQRYADLYASMLSRT